MDKSNNKNLLFLNGIKYLLKLTRRTVIIIFSAFIIGFSNALNDESKSIYDIRNFDQQEQVIDEEDVNE
ncbi:MAG: hypothetical protein PF541_11985 [Prolixibacteraceae bacterium]|jgi:hypothetical protein|nr:hypothetical protein [Prolixibacteraceae bacterium]